MLRSSKIKEKHYEKILKHYKNITILTLSIGLVSAPPVLARQVVDPTDYIGYKHLARQTVDPTDYVGYAQGTYIPSKNVRHERVTDDASKYVHQSHSTDTPEFARYGQNADARESRRIGKLLWKTIMFKLIIHGDQASKCWNGLYFGKLAMFKVATATTPT